MEGQEHDSDLVEKAARAIRENLNHRSDDYRDEAVAVLDVVREHQRQSNPRSGLTLNNGFSISFSIVPFDE